MRTETIEKWQTLIQQQAISDLPITRFCKEKQISPTCFYKYKSQLQTDTQSSIKKSFIKVQAPVMSNTSAAIKIQYQQTTLTLASTLEPMWLATLLKAFA